jgi:hypothetical protein
MRYSTQVRPISFLKANAAEVMRQLDQQREPMVITQNGTAKAVIQDVVIREYGTIIALALIYLVRDLHTSPASTPPRSRPGRPGPTSRRLSETSNRRSVCCTSRRSRPRSCHRWSWMLAGSTTDSTAARFPRRPRSSTPPRSAAVPRPTRRTRTPCTSPGSSRLALVAPRRVGPRLIGRIALHRGLQAGRVRRQIRVPRRVPARARDQRMAPAPDAGGLACVPMPAFTNARNRPTVISYLSR